MSDWLNNLNKTLAVYPCTASKRRRSRLIQNGDTIEICFKFNASIYDHIDALVVNSIADRVKSKQCEPSDGKAATVCFRCSEEQAHQFGRYLAYASTVPMAAKPPVISIANTPLSVLLTHALAEFTREYEQSAPKQGLPRLEVWSNVLRVVPKRGVEIRSLGRLAVLSTRTIRVVTRHCVDLGWLEIEKPPRRGSQTVVKLTAAGAKVQQLAVPHIRKVEALWGDRYGSKLDRLKSVLKTIVHSLDLEYPYYVTGYGPADEALTGGSYLPACEGPPRIPTRGMEWPVVIKQHAHRSVELPLSALLSQTLTAFALDYEAEQLGRLGLTTLFFRHLQDEGMSLADARRLQEITGNGKSLHERHFNIVLEPGKPSDGTRLIFPTQKTRVARDAFPYQVEKIYSRWRERFGRTVVQDLRRSLEALNETWPADLPDYPNTTAWMVPWYRPFFLSD